MQDSKTLLAAIAKPRPVGTSANNDLCDFLDSQLSQLGYKTASLPFDCLVWDREKSHCAASGQHFSVAPSPYSQPYTGTAPFLVLESLDGLKQADARGKILVLRGELTAEPLQPKEYPFYYPDHHRAIIDTLEQSGCAAVLAVTGQHPMCGLNPFPLVLDGNFAVPSAYINEAAWREIVYALQGGRELALTIASRTWPAQSRQVVGTAPAANAKGKALVCAHMDSAYDTPAALDNGTGTAMLLQTAARCAGKAYNSTLEFAPFNSEEYFGYTAELRYLEWQKQQAPSIKLVVNIDSPCHIGSQIAVAAYNLEEDALAGLERLLEKHPGVVMGDQWYAGDHIPFLQQGIPCITVASNDFSTGGLADTHTPRDTMDSVDIGQIDDGAAFLAELLETLA